MSIFIVRTDANIEINRRRIIFEYCAGLEDVYRRYWERSFDCHCRRFNLTITKTFKLVFVMKKREWPASSCVDKTISSVTQVSTQVAAHSAMRRDRFFGLVQEHQSEEVLYNVFLQLYDVKTLLVSSQVNRFWRSIGSCQGLWKSACDLVWSDKVYVPIECKELYTKGQHRSALLLSIIDSRRVRMTVEELTSNPFYFRFKSSAGSFWTENDPYWNGKGAIQVGYQFCFRTLALPQIVPRACQHSR